MLHIIFSDIDGTLYDRSLKPTDDNVQKIKESLDKGLVFAFATGNPSLGQIRKLLKSFGGKYLIGSNGASVYDVEKNEYIFKSMIPFSKVKKLVALAKEFNLGFGCWDEEEFYLKNANVEYQSFIEESILRDKKTKSLDEIKGDLFKFECYGDEKIVDEFFKAVKKADSFHAIRMKSNHLEITNTNVNKSLGIKFLVEKLGTNVDRIMTIGDGLNDLEMLAMTKYSYAMANGKDRVKEVAKLHTSSVEQSGLAEAIDDFMFRMKIK